MRIHKLDQFVEDSLLNESFLVDTRRNLLEINRGFNRLSQVPHEFHVDVGFEES